MALYLTQPNEKQLGRPWSTLVEGDEQHRECVNLASPRDIFILFLFSCNWFSVTAEVMQTQSDITVKTKGAVINYP